VLKQGSVDLGTLDHHDNLLFVRPILRDAGDRYIVAIPSTLVLALCNALVALALEDGVQEELADRHRWAVFFTVEQSLGFSGNDLISMMEPELGEPSTCPIPRGRSACSAGRTP